MSPRGRPVSWRIRDRSVAIHRWMDERPPSLGLPAFAQSTVYRKIGEMELRLLGVSATVDPLHPVVPKNIPSARSHRGPRGGHRAVARRCAALPGAGHPGRGRPLRPRTARRPSAFPCRPQASRLPPIRFLLPLPGLTVSGNYTLTNLRIESEGRPVLDVTPQTVTVEVIEQVLVTSVKTRALTLDEIREKGIVLDSDDYLGFEFTLGLKLESQAVTLSFPVVFDRQGVPIPDPLTPPPPPRARACPCRTMVPLLLDAFADGGGPGDGGGQRIPLTLPNGAARPHPGGPRHPGQRRLPEAVLLGAALRRERGARGVGPHRAERDGHDQAAARGRPRAGHGRRPARSARDRPGSPTVDPPVLGVKNPLLGSPCCASRRR